MPPGDQEPADERAIQTAEALALVTARAAEPHYALGRGAHADREPEAPKSRGFEAVGQRHRAARTRPSDSTHSGTSLVDKCLFVPAQDGPGLGGQNASRITPVARFGLQNGGNKHAPVHMGRGCRRDCTVRAENPTRGPGRDCGRNPAGACSEWVSAPRLAQVPEVLQGRMHAVFSARGVRMAEVLRENGVRGFALVNRLSKKIGNRAARWLRLPDRRG